MFNIETRKNILEDIFKIISIHTGISENKIYENSKLGNDLGLDGDDAYEVLEKINSRYKLNINFKAHFNDEANIWGINNWFNKYFNKSKYIYKSEITIKDILNNIESHN